MQYLVEGISKYIIGYLMEDYGYDLTTALKEFYNSGTFAKLSDEAPDFISKVRLMCMKC